MIKRVLAHISPEELLLIPVVILVILGVILQPTAITRLFETPYATPIPGDSPADEVLNDATPAPVPSPAGAVPTPQTRPLLDRASGRTFEATIVTTRCDDPRFQRTLPAASAGSEGVVVCVMTTRVAPPMLAGR